MKGSEIFVPKLSSYKITDLAKSINAKKKISSEQFFYDVIYNPSETNFLQSARKNGNRTENGKKMFIYQAQASFKIWNNLEPQVDKKVMEPLN